LTGESEYLADQIRRSWEGPAWHGPSLSEVLQGIDESTAVLKIRPDQHSIFEIVQHLSSWASTVAGAIRGTPLPHEEWPGDWPADTPSWSTLSAELSKAMEQLVSAVRHMPTAQLGAIVPGRDYEFRFLLHGMPQHHCYHAGQIALLRKLRS
jgi:hypothetical protein